MGGMEEVVAIDQTSICKIPNSNFRRSLISPYLTKIKS